MADPVLETAMEKSAGEIKDYLRKSLASSYCAAGGTQAQCTKDIDALVDTMFNTSVYIVKLQAKDRSKPVPVTLILEFASAQMKTHGDWAGMDLVSCTAATVSFALGLKTTVAAIAINGVIAEAALTSGLGWPLALGAGAMALGAAGFLFWGAKETYGACAPMFESGPSSSSTTTGAPAYDFNANRRHAEELLILLQHDASVQNSCKLT